MSRERSIFLQTLLAAVPLLLVACGAAEGPDWLTLRPVSDFGRMGADVYSDLIWWTLGIFVVVELLLLYALVRYRSSRSESEVPSQVHGFTALEIAWTLLPAAILFFIAIPTVRTIFALQGAPPANGDALEITVVGHQWWWEFQYPELGFVTANELHVPVGRTANLTLKSADVIHSFWVPQIGGKRDLNPGSENRLWFTPTEVAQGRK